MFGIGKLLATPVKIINAPIRAVENFVEDNPREDDRILSRPLNKLAEQLEEIDNDDE